MMYNNKRLMKLKMGQTGERTAGNSPAVLNTALL